MNSLQDRITALERQNAELKQELKQIKDFLQVGQFIKPLEASKILGISTHTIYNRIKHCKAFPNKSKFKEGVHWIQKNFPSAEEGEVTIRYYVNPTEWQKAEQV
jgi:predicted DNA-binding transcriptional regulator AlpA